MKKGVKLLQKVHLDDFCIPKNTIVSCKEMGNIYELCYQDKVNDQILIKKINENEYIYLPTGEVLQCNHITNRSQSLFQVGQSLKRLRDYINTNVVEPKNCKWVTLTYKENMTNTKRLYEDFKKFIKRFNYHFKEYKFEYIVAMEPQGRGAWHAHLILIFDRLAPYIPNKTIEKLWQQGFCKTKKLDNVDNVGAYLTAYLGDIEYTDKNFKDALKNMSFVAVKEVNEIEGIKLKEPKKFIKGGRLYMYPPKFNLYRCSRGIKKPKKYLIDYETARKKIGLSQPTFSSAIKLIDVIDLSGDIQFQKTIAYEFFNTKRVVPQN